MLKAVIFRLEFNYLSKKCPKTKLEMLLIPNLKLEVWFEVRSVFLDISKAFDNVWHAGIIFKIKQNVILDDLLNILSDFLRNRKQRVTLNGQSFS